jgi:hypothetical protein
MLLVACASQPTPSPEPPSPTPVPTVSATVTPSLPPASPPAPVASPSPLPATPPAPAASPSPLPRGTVPTQPEASCRLGSGLRQEMGPILVQYKDQPGFVMAATVGQAQTYFPQMEGWIRGLGAPSLEGLRQKAELARQAGLEYEALVYGLEAGKATPEAEWQDLVGSTQKARALADEFGKLLLMGPGFRLMSENEDKYPAMAALADVWMLQTQRLQVNPPGTVYREEVERVLKLIRSGNPQVKIWAQITLPPDREPNAEEWLAYRQSILDLVDGTYLGVYTWNREDTQTLLTAIEAVFAGACGGE